MNPINDFLFDPDPSIGGAIVPIIGMPGSGKTVGLTQIGLKNLDSGNTVMWRGTKQCQWIHFLANDTKVIVWNHDTIRDFEAYITSEGNDDIPESVDLESHGVEIRQWSDANELVNGLEKDVVNVVNIPGLENQDQNDMYFFREMWLNIFDALIERRSGDMICFLFDEIGDVIPSQQQLRKPFYKLVAEFLPPKLSQMRKKRVLLYGAAHATHDTHYFFWKIKANSIVYMSNAVVKKNVTPGVDQADVNDLDRGQFIFPPKTDAMRFKLPYLADKLDWIPARDSAFLNCDWESDIPDRLDEAKNDDDDSLTKGQLGRMVWKDTDLSQQDVASAIGIKQSAISQASLPNE